MINDGREILETTRLAVEDKYAKLLERRARAEQRHQEELRIRDAQLASQHERIRALAEELLRLSSAQRGQTSIVQQKQSQHVTPSLSSRLAVDDAEIQHDCQQASASPPWRTLMTSAQDASRRGGGCGPGVMRDAAVENNVEIREQRLKDDEETMLALQAEVLKRGRQLETREKTLATREEQLVLQQESLAQREACLETAQLNFARERDLFEDERKRALSSLRQAGAHLDGQRQENMQMREKLTVDREEFERRQEIARHAAEDMIALILKRQRTCSTEIERVIEAERAAQEANATAQQQLAHSTQQQQRFIQQQLDALQEERDHIAKERESLRLERERHRRAVEATTRRWRQSRSTNVAAIQRMQSTIERIVSSSRSPPHSRRRPLPRDAEGTPTDEQTPQKREIREPSSVHRATEPGSTIVTAASFVTHPAKVVAPHAASGAERDDRAPVLERGKRVICSPLRRDAADGGNTDDSSNFAPLRTTEGSATATATATPPRRRMAESNAVDDPSVGQRHVAGVLEY